MNNSFFSRTTFFDNEKYIISFSINSGMVNINISPEDPLISLYLFYVNLSLENFYSLGKCFRQCDNLEEILNFISTSHNIYIDIQNFQLLNLYICLPWCGNSFETIRIVINGFLKGDIMQLSYQLINKYKAMKIKLKELENKEYYYNPFKN